MATANDIEALIDGLGAGGKRAEEYAPDQREFVVNQNTGSIRQAGAADQNTEWASDFRKRAESDLYVYAKSVLGLDRLTSSLHLEVCRWLQVIPPYRKMYLLPRDHLKTSIARSLASHILIQPKESNIYFPGCQDKKCRFRRKPTGTLCNDPAHKMDGSDTRILFASETAANASRQLQWIRDKFVASKLIQVLWPHKTWTNPRKEADVWNNEAFVLPRPNTFPEASVESIGVGGAVTGRHYTVMIKDDLISVEARNSAIVMEGAIEWHVGSRALFDDPDEGLEFILGTRWAVYDLYKYILDNDPTVDPMIRGIVEDGKPIFPEMFSDETIARKKTEFGLLFPLLYMNNASDPQLTDFDITLLRQFVISQGSVVFEENEKDFTLAHSYTQQEEATTDETFSGQPLNDVYDRLKSRHAYLRQARG